MADIGVRGFGANPAEAFEQAACAMMAVVADLQSIRPVRRVSIECAAPDLEILLADFMVEMDRQESEIDEHIHHGEFFLRESGKFHCNANPMFDRLRLLYTSQVDALRKEKRQVRLKKIEKKMGFLKELQEADKELSPFSKFF